MTHKEKFKIRTSECDNKMKLIPAAILDMFQETAGRHCVPTKLDSPSLIKKHNSTWVLTAMAIEFKEFPKWPEEVEVETWAKSFTGFKAFRDYKVYNKDGKSIVAGASIWAMLNLDTHRPTKIDTIASAMTLNSGVDALNVKPGKLELDSDNFEETLIKVTFGDIDMNNHVSNIQYIAWLYQNTNKEYLENSELRSLNIAYKGEAYLNDELIYKSSINNGSGSHIFVNRDTGREICKISSTWETIN